MYKALIEIGGYLPGQEVPAELAKTWLGMYVKAPVEKVGQIPKKEEVKKVEGSSAMYDDYLNRNQNVVVKNIKLDNLGEKVLSDLLTLEKKDKNRKQVIQAIKFKLNK